MLAWQKFETDKLQSQQVKGDKLVGTTMAFDKVYKEEITH
jgi:hypothetical protein